VDGNADGKRCGAKDKMVKCFNVRRGELQKTIDGVLKDAKEPLYRCLGKQAKEDYEQKGALQPYDGSMSVGCGVFFTNNLDYALGFLDEMLVVTDRKMIDPDECAIDTRMKGYYEPIEDRLRQTLGEGNYNGWTIEEEVQKNDTIRYEGGSRDAYVFSKREPVPKDKLLAEIRIIH